jgi:hypothetical protein
MKISKIIPVLPAVILLAGCSGSTEDVQLTLCKQLTGEMFFGNYQKSDWLSEDMKFNGYDDLEVVVKYRTESGEGETRCYFAYDTTAEDNAMHLANPATAYSTYPSKVVQNGVAVSSQLYANKINEILLKQGKEAIQVPIDKISKEVKSIKL